MQYRITLRATAVDGETSDKAVVGEVQTSDRVVAVDLYCQLSRLVGTTVTLYNRTGNSYGKIAQIDHPLLGNPAAEAIEQIVEAASEDRRSLSVWMPEGQTRLLEDRFAVNIGDLHLMAILEDMPGTAMSNGVKYHQVIVLLEAEETDPTEKEKKF